MKQRISQPADEFELKMAPMLFEMDDIDSMAESNDEDESDVTVELTREYSPSRRGWNDTSFIPIESLYEEQYDFLGRTLSA